MGASPPGDRAHRATEFAATARRRAGGRASREPAGPAAGRPTAPRPPARAAALRSRAAAAREDYSPRRASRRAAPGWGRPGAGGAAARGAPSPLASPWRRPDVTPRGLPAGAAVCQRRGRSGGATPASPPPPPRGCRSPQAGRAGPGRGLPAPGGPVAPLGPPAACRRQVWPSSLAAGSFLSGLRGHSPPAAAPVVGETTRGGGAKAVLGGKSGFVWGSGQRWPRCPKSGFVTRCATSQ